MSVDLDNSLSEVGFIEYKRLLRIVRASRGRFAVLPIESDFSSKLRDALLERLSGDLSSSKAKLHIIQLGQHQWDILHKVESLPDCGSDSVIALTGLENTPDMFLEPGTIPRRPPALALLNLAREALRRRISAPIIVWCDPVVFTRLQENAPDLFDHYTALFTFLDANLVPTCTGIMRDIRSSPDDSQHISQPRSAIGFYEEMVAHYPEPTLDRVNALLGLANAEIQIKDEEYSGRLIKAQSLADEAGVIADCLDNDYLRARVLITIGAVLIERQDGDESANIEEAINRYRTAIDLLPVNQYPEAWAVAQNNLGRAYSARLSEDREASLRHAIACYEAVQLVWTEKTNPRLWAASMRDLGSAYHSLPTGNRTANYKKALSCYETALRVLTEDDTPLDWAMTQVNIGNLYADLPSGDPSENLRIAIVCLTHAMHVARKHNYQFEAATAQYNLGMVYSALTSGDRLDNLSKALENLEGALRIRTSETYRYEWAMTMVGLGTTYYRLAIIEKKREHIEKAKSCYNSGLIVYSQKERPMEWAGLQNNLGAVCLTAGDFSEATKHFQLALHVWTEKTMPYEWAMANYNLAIALRGQSDNRSITSVRVCLEAAARGFRTLGLDEMVSRALHGLATIDDVKQAA